MIGGYLDDAVDDHHVLAVGHVLDTSEGAADDADEGDDGVAQFGAVVVQQLHEEVELVALLDLEEVVAN